MALNIKDKIETQLPKETQKILADCAQVAHLTGLNIYLIGGVVRDLLLGRQIVDVDVTVEGSALDFCHKLVEEKLCQIVQVQDKLNTVKAIFDNNIEIDFASTRQEFYPKRGHLPVATKIGCTLQEDIYRRDFTINALALSLNKENYGDVIDYVNGLKDLENKELKVLHDKSFIEDPSRIIRGLKFAARFDFHRDKKTKELQYTYQKECVHRDISWTRIKNELKSAFSLNLARVFDMFNANGVGELIYAKKSDLTGSEIKRLIDNKQPDHPWLIYLGCVLNDVDVIEAFCFTREEKKIFTDVAFLMSSNLSMLNSNYDIYKFFEKKSLESVLIYYLLTKRKEPLIYIEKLSNIRVELKGSDLVELGLEEGKQIGEMLDRILKKKLSGNIVNRDDEIKFVKSKIIKM